MTKIYYGLEFRQVMKNWNMGIIEGLIFHSGIFNSTPLIETIY